MNNLLKEKERLLSKNLFSNWKVFSQLIRKTQYRIDINNLLDNLLKYANIKGIIVIDSDVRKFITSYTMVHFDMFDKTSTKDMNLYYKSTELHQKFEDIFSNNLNKENISEFFKKFKEYITAFKEWKEQDEKVLLDKSCVQQYKEIKVIQQKFSEGTTPDEKQLSASASMLKAKMEKRIKQIGGNRAMEYVNNSPKLNPIDTLHVDMEETMKNAFWDMFEEDLENNNLNPIHTTLSDFRKYLFQLLGNTVRANTIKEEFDSKLDLELLKQMIEKGVMDAEKIYNIMQLLTGYVQEYVQSASEDKDTKMIMDNVYNMMVEQKKTTGHILRYFFQNMFKKLDKTKIQVALIKQQLQPQKQESK